LFYPPESFYKDNGIELVLGRKVSHVLPKKNRVVCEDKTNFDYDVLLIATGARPRIPEIKGIRKAGVFGFRTLQDVKEIQSLLPVVKCVCVMGGGLVGIAAASALRRRAMEVKVVVSSSSILSRVFDPGSSALIQKRLEDNGIEFVIRQDVSEIIGEGDIKAVKLSSGKIFAASLVVAGKGVEPNIGAAQESGIQINTGIPVDAFMRTNIGNIYAAGDVCESPCCAGEGTPARSFWADAVEQGAVAGENMAGGAAAYERSIRMSSLEFFGLQAVSMGTYELPGNPSGFEELNSSDPGRGFYRRIIFKDNMLAGAVLTGNIEAGTVFLRLMKEKADVSSIKERLLAEDFVYPGGSGPLAEKEQTHV
ncbi:MAG: FAD-dependent oxidoreductase, partial [Candidatus Omnitrophota bacterium]